MTDDPVILFEEYAARYRRGERPDVREYLVRAGDRRGALAALVDELLREVPPPRASADRALMLEAWLQEEPPLLELRTSRGVRREAVVDGLVRDLELRDDARGRVADYYHDLEVGLLDPGPVDRRVLESIARALRIAAGDLLTWRPAQPSLASPAFRLEPGAAPPAAPAGLPQPGRPAPVERDELDRLFLGEA